LDNGVTALIAVAIGVGACIAASNMARRKGRSRVWGFFSFWFAPTLIILWLMPARRGHALMQDEAKITSLHQPNGTQIVTERYQRSFFGKLVSTLFWSWQALMLLWAISYLSSVSQQYGSGSDVNRIGIAAGGTIGMSVILWVWLFGAIIFGLMMYFTRGEKVIITKMS
jgi:hypothetical protein